jgi:predicted unusual protein kinase regulating ubiquinone biosynthesis (AarF/ABC1/UbiB family)
MHYDLKLMRMFVNTAKMLFKDFKYEWLLEEFECNIKKELDFEQEAHNMKLVEDILRK